MATLNIKETQQVRDAMKVLQQILVEGYDPNREDSQTLQRARLIKTTRLGLHQVWSKKGKFSG